MIDFSRDCKGTLVIILPTAVLAPNPKPYYTPKHQSLGTCSCNCVRGFQGVTFTKY